MHRISSHTEDELAAFEQQAEDLMVTALQSVMDQIADRVIQHASVPVLAAGPPEDVPGQPYVSPDDLSSITPLWRAQVARMLPLIADIYAESGGRVHAGLVEATNLPDISDAASAAASGYLAQVQNVYEDIGSDLWETARGELVDGFNNGESIDQLADRLRGSAAMTARRASLVARSTVVEASNAGSIATAKASGLDMHKEWIATSDARTRPTHRIADGQQVDLHDMFTVGGFSAEVPGDPSLPAQEKYNCRCTVGYVIPDEQPAGQAPSQPAAQPVDTEQAARDRQAEIDAARGYAELSADAEKLIADQASQRAFAHTLRSRVTAGKLPAGAADELIAAHGDAAQLDLALERLAAQNGLTRNTVRAGQVERLDRQRMDLIGESVPDGAPVSVIRPGYSVSVRGEDVQVLRATVDAASPEEAAAFRAAQGESTAESIAAERRARRAAARSRSAEIEAAKPYAALSSEIDQLIAQRRGIWSPELGRQLDQVRIAARQAGIPLEDLIPLSNAINDESIGHVTLAARELAGRRGLTVVGRVGQRVAYDPRTMEPVGEIAYDEGQQVQIWRVGQNLALSDGSSMVLDKAIVRSVSGELRTAKVIMRDARRASARGDRVAQAALDEEIGEAYTVQLGDFSTSVVSSNVTYRTARIDGIVLDANGNRVGTFIRTLRRGDDGKLIAHHSSLDLKSTVQGSGFAARFNSQLFDFYRRSGVDRVTVFADDDIGGYTWAAQGFDFADARAASGFRTDMRSRIRNEFSGPNLYGAAQRMGVDPQDLDDQVTHFEALLARAENGEHIKAFEFSQVGRQPGQGGRNAIWLGKKLMLGSSWNGVLPL